MSDKCGQHRIMTSAVTAPVSGRQSVAHLRQSFRRGPQPTLGCPVRPLLWVSKSHDKLAVALQSMGHRISANSVRCVTKGRSTTAFIRRSSTRRLGTGSRKSSRAQARGGQCDAEEPLDLRFVVDDEDAKALHGAGRISMAVGWAPGSRMTICVPRRRTAGLCATIVPPMASIRPRQIDRPRPVPGLRPSARPPR